MSNKNNMINSIIDNLSNVITLQNFQTYVLGTKKNGTPRALYDVIEDYSVKKKGKKKKKDKDRDKDNTFSLYLQTKKSKKKKKKKNKHWHI